MRKLIYLSTLLVTALFCCHNSYAQDFSNKGKDFWVAYGYHTIMASSNTQNMVLYFAAEQNTNVTVNIPGLGYTQNYFVAANTVLTSNPIPKAGAQDARLITESTTPENKGIHITADKPIVAYAHIYNQSVSGASILFPTATLGREYYSINYKNISNTGAANCWFYVVAADTGTTTVEITPSAQTLTRPAGVPFLVTLTQGQVYNIMGEYSGNSGVDLTGSLIRSINTGSGCKRISVFSGSGRISISCNNSPSSSDNYMVQAFPKTAWGRKFLTTTSGGNQSNNIYRICVSDPTTAVILDGAPITYPLSNNFYYELPASNAPHRIEADNPITVAQYLTSQGECGNGSTPGDPEVIYLSPVEQNINRVLWNATPNFNISQHFYNIIIPNTGTAISSFRIDGAPVAGQLFTQHPQDPGYSYLTQQIGAGQHIIQSDSGFNAIAYGYGNAESYGYNAGTNIKDIFQYLSIQNQQGTVNFPSTCQNSPFYFSMTFPYQPTEIQWKFGPTLNAMGIADVTLTNPIPTSTIVVSGKTLYVYQLPTAYSIPVLGTYPIKVIAQNPTPDGCGGVQEVDFDVEVYESPVADFNFVTDGCVTNPVSFSDNSTTNGRPQTAWYWNFGDGNTSATNNPTHIYGTPGSYTVKYSLVTDIGCVSDTASKIVTVNSLPLANFTTSGPYCEGDQVSFSDASTSANGAITGWEWDFGDGNTSSLQNTVHTYATAGVYNVTLTVQTGSGCSSLGFTTQVTVFGNPTSDFAIPASVCLPSGAAQFNDLSSAPAGSSVAAWQWNFGDGSPVSNVQNPLHNYTATGPYNVTLQVTSDQGCVDTKVSPINTIYAEPQASFNSLPEVCVGSLIGFSDLSNAPGSTITGWNWDFGDGSPVSNTQNPSHIYTSPGTFTITLVIVSANGCQSQPYSSEVIVNHIPNTDFSITSVVCVPNGEAQFNDLSSVPAGSTITTWNWDFGDGSPVSTIQNPSHIYASTGNYTVTLSVATDKGCIAPIFSRSITVNDRPNAGFTPPEICISDTDAPFFDNSTIAAGTVTGWEWDFGDPGSGANNTSTSQNPTHTYTTVGTYIAQLIATSAQGCKDTIQQQFVVNGSIPVADFNVQNSTTLCSNMEVSIQDASSVDFGSIIRAEIYWDYLNDPTNKTTDLNPVPGKIYSNTYTEFGTPATRSYRIRYVVYSGINCVHSITRDITLLATPTLRFDPVPFSCSVDNSFQITQAQLLNGLAGSGVFTGTGVTSGGIFSPTVAGTGLHAIRYTYTGTNGCTNFAEQTVAVYQTPAINAGPDKVVLEGGQVTLTPVQNIGDPLTYLWSPPSGLNDPTVAFPIASPATDITYTLTVTTDKGCTASDDVFVKLLKAPAIPNIFSPNGDGVHDRWVIEYLDTYPGCTVDVYNRYGQLVYHSVGYSTPWDGTVNGKPVPVGTYYYIVNPKNGRSQMSGYVDVIR